MSIFYDGKYKPLAQKLRREMTPQEKHLWYDCLKHLPLTFRRQKQFGPYIADFYCAKARLVVEIDGSQHYEAEERDKDQEREAYLERQYGLKVLRFTNVDIDRSFAGVYETIEREIAEREQSEEEEG